MVSSYLIVALLFIHLLSDFGLQPRWIGENKSKDIGILTLHICLYSLGLTAGLYMWLLIKPTEVIYFIGVNVTAHFVIDFFTSKASSWFWANGYKQFFWWMIGFDQFLHTGLLALTAPWLI